MIKNEGSVYTALAQAAIAAIENSAANITAALTQASGTIVGATTTAAGDINTRAAILIQSEIDLLVKDVQTVVGIVQGINATVSVVSTFLRGEYFPRQRLAVSRFLLIILATSKSFFLQYSYTGY